MHVDGDPVGVPTPARMLRLGVTVLPEDPIADEVVPGMTVAEHFVIGSRDAPTKGSGYDWNAITEASAAEPAAQALPWPRRRARYARCRAATSSAS